MRSPYFLLHPGQLQLRKPLELGVLALSVRYLSPSRTIRLPTNFEGQGTFFVRRLVLAKISKHQYLHGLGTRVAFGKSNLPMLDKN